MKTYAYILPLLLTTTTFANPTTQETTSFGSSATFATKEETFKTTFFAGTYAKTRTHYVPTSYTSSLTSTATTTFTTTTR